MIKETSNINDFLSEFEEEGTPNIITELDGEEGVETIITDPTKGTSLDDDFLTEPPVDGDDDEEEKQEEESDDSEETEDTTGDEFSYKAFLSHLNEEGVVEFEDSEELEDKPDLVYESVKKTIQKGINSYKESLPDEGKKFLSYLEQGGDPKKYVETLQRPLDLDSVDLDNESDQELVMREFLKLSDFSEDEINETIADYKEGLILDKQSKVAAKKLEKVFEKRSQSLLEEQEQIAQQRAEQYNTYVNTVNQTIDTSNAIAGLEITKAEKDSFRKYLLARDKDGLTAYEREYQENPVQTSLELAYLKFKKYDFGKAIKQGETIANKKLNWKLKQNDTNIKTGRTKAQSSQDADFSAFQAFLGKQG